MSAISLFILVLAAVVIGGLSVYCAFAEASKSDKRKMLFGFLGGVVVAFLIVAVPDESKNTFCEYEMTQTACEKEE